MTVALLVVTDGRDDCLAEAVASLELHVSGPITERYIYDDTGDDAHAVRIAHNFPGYTVWAPGKRQGFGGAIRWAWKALTKQSRAEWVLHWEDDMVAVRPVDLVAMTDALTVNPHLAQMALRRQAWSEPERAAGGVVEQHPDDYTDVTAHNGAQWLEHRRFFTTNPCVYRRALCAAGWPDGKHSEGHYGFRLREHGLPWGIPGDDVRFAFWGARSEDPWVHHIGHQRVGTGY